MRRANTLDLFSRPRTHTHSHTYLSRKINVLRVFVFEEGDGIGDGFCKRMKISSKRFLIGSFSLNAMSNLAANEYFSLINQNDSGINLQFYYLKT